MRSLSRTSNFKFVDLISVEIPLYHILNACVTFGNLYGGDAPAYGVICNRSAVSSTTTNASGEPLVSNNSVPANPAASGHSGRVEPTSCVVEDCVFDVGRGYHLIGKYCGIDIPHAKLLCLINACPDS